MNHYVPKDISRYYADVIRPKNRMYYDWRHELEQEDYNNREPDHELWAACLAQGIQSASEYLIKPSEENRIDFRWILSEEYYLGSFRYLCDLFNLNHKLVRKLALSGTKQLVYTNYRPNIKKLLVAK